MYTYSIFVYMTWNILGRPLAPRETPNCLIVAGEHDPSRLGALVVFGSVCCLCGDGFNPSKCPPARR
jgi:hypothetical protein